MGKNRLIASAGACRSFRSCAQPRTARLLVSSNLSELVPILRHGLQVLLRGEAASRQTFRRGARGQLPRAIHHGGDSLPRCCVAGSGSSRCMRGEAREELPAAAKAGQAFLAQDVFQYERDLRRRSGHSLHAPPLRGVAAGGQSSVCDGDGAKAEWVQLHSSLTRAEAVDECRHRLHAKRDTSDHVSRSIFGTDMPAQSQENESASSPCLEPPL